MELTSHILRLLDGGTQLSSHVLVFDVLDLNKPSSSTSIQNSQSTRGICVRNAVTDSFSTIATHNIVCCPLTDNAFIMHRVDKRGSIYPMRVETMGICFQNGFIHIPLWRCDLRPNT